MSVVLDLRLLMLPGHPQQRGQHQATNATSATHSGVPRQRRDSPKIIDCGPGSGMSGMIAVFPACPGGGYAVSRMNTAVRAAMILLMRTAHGPMRRAVRPGRA